MDKPTRIKFSRLTQDEKNAILILHNQKRPYSIISTETGIPRATVHDFLSRINKLPDPPHYSEYYPVEQVIGMLEEGMTYIDVAQQSGWSEATLYRTKAHYDKTGEYKIPSFRNYNPENKKYSEEALSAFLLDFELTDPSVPIQEIASRHGMSYSVAYKVAKEHGLLAKRKGSYLSGDEIDEIVLMLEAGTSIKEIVQKTGRSKSSIYRIAAELKKPVKTPKEITPFNGEVFIDAQDDKSAPAEGFLQSLGKVIAKPFKSIAGWFK